MKSFLVPCAVLGLAIVCFGIVRWRFTASGPADSESPGARSQDAESIDAGESTQALPKLIHESDGRKFMTIPESLKRSMRLTSEPALASTGGAALRLTGQLMLDPSRLVHVNTRFDGEVVRIEESIPTTTNTRATLRVGDRVQKGQLLAVIWSKEIGEKKSDLVDAISQLMQHEATYNNMKSAEKSGALPQRSIDEMRRTVESDIIQVQRLRRTLRSWRLDESDLSEIESEASRVHAQFVNSSSVTRQETQADPKIEREWAEVDIRSPMDGEILEMNLAVGDMVTSSDDLFKIADLSRLVVMANVYEEDLSNLKRLPANSRKWVVKLVSQPESPECPGEFLSIGSVIDPNQHTAVVQGWIDNSQGNLQVGQFVEALVDKPGEAGLVEFSNRAIIDAGAKKYVFVALDKDLGRVERREVQLQRRTAQRAYVASADPTGVKPGEHVLLNGLLELSDVWNEQSGPTGK